MWRKRPARPASGARIVENPPAGSNRRNGGHF